jgi:hypothetical protein
LGENWEHQQNCLGLWKLRLTASLWYHRGNLNHLGTWVLFFRQMSIDQFLEIQHILYLNYHQFQDAYLMTFTALNAIYRFLPEKDKVLIIPITCNASSGWFHTWIVDNILTRGTFIEKMINICQHNIFCPPSSTLNRVSLQTVLACCLHAGCLAWLTVLEAHVEWRSQVTTHWWVLWFVHLACNFWVLIL